MRLSCTGFKRVPHRPKPDAQPTRLMLDDVRDAVAVEIDNVVPMCRVEHRNSSDEFPRIETKFAEGAGIETHPYFARFEVNEIGTAVAIEIGDAGVLKGPVGVGRR